MITAFQIIAILFSLFALSRAILRFKSRQITLGMLLFWSFIWLSTILASLIPRIVQPFAVFFGTRAADLVIFVGLIGSYYLLFRIYVRLEKLSQEITFLVRKIALIEAKK